MVACSRQRPLPTTLSGSIDAGGLASARPLCVTCNQNYTELRKSGYRKQCWTCRPSGRVESKSKRLRRLYLKDRCELCNFVPVNRCQLDLDHKDADRYNNDPSNFQTLCANCHRLKTWQERDHLVRYKDGQKLPGLH